MVQHRKDKQTEEHCKVKQGLSTAWGSAQQRQNKAWQSVATAQQSSAKRCNGKARYNIATAKQSKTGRGMAKQGQSRAKQGNGKAKRSRASQGFATA